MLRWSPGADERWQDYAVEAGADTTVLDALVEIQRGQDPGLAFRYACRVGMCGSCGVVVNGRERWACRTPLSTLGPGRITVRPLYHFPVLRDLVVDMAPFTARMRAVGAAFTPGDGERRDARISGDSAERQEIDEAIECIGCGLCVSACTIVAHNARFPGPAALNRAFTLQRDSRDTARSTRWGVLLSDDALARCHGQANCTDVCPMGLAPTRSIIRLRQMATARIFKWGPDMAPAYFSEGGYAPLALLRPAFGASRQSRDARLRDVPLTDFPRSPVPATRRSRDRAAVPRSGSRADAR